METIGSQKVWTFAADRSDCHSLSNTGIRESDAHEVYDYTELATKVAELQFRNRDFVLMFRGQPEDYTNRDGNTSLKPAIMRGPTKASNPTDALLKERFERLQQAEARLVKRYEKGRLLGVERMRRQKILRWSVIQHYGISPTPLLDVTHSLRIAASFASIEAKRCAEREAYLFVLGVPNLSGAVTASAEAGLQIIRLSSVCPPMALRPHLQEGYLLGEYPEMTGIDQQQHYRHYEIDFGRRLVAKFRFKPQNFWEDRAFPEVKRVALYPDVADPFFSIAEEIMAPLSTYH